MLGSYSTSELLPDRAPQSSTAPTPHCSHQYGVLTNRNHNSCIKHYKVQREFLNTKRGLVCAYVVMIWQKPRQLLFMNKRCYLLPYCESLQRALVGASFPLKIL